MPAISNGGSGANIDAKVDLNNRLHTSGTVHDLHAHATVHGRSYNINTGLISLTAGTVSGVMYFKNDNVEDFVVANIAVGLLQGTLTDDPIVRVVKNPTSVSFSASVDVNQNRNFGSSETLASTSLIYKGAEGATVTGGDDILIFAAKESSRLFATIDLVIPRGKSLAVTVDPNISTGSMSIYVALIGYLRDVEND